MDLIGFYRKLEEKSTPKQEFREMIAEACGVAPATVSRWVYGEIIPEKLKREKISQVIGIPVEELFPNLQSDEV